MSAVADSLPPGAYSEAAADMVEIAYDSIMDCQAVPLIKAVCELDEDGAKRMLHTVAYLAGTLAAHLPDETRKAVLASCRTGAADQP